MRHHIWKSRSQGHHYYRLLLSSSMQLLTQIPNGPSFHTNFQPLYFNISGLHVYIKSTIFNNPSTLRQSLPSWKSNLNCFAITTIFTGYYSFKSHGASTYCCSGARLFHPRSRKRIPKTHFS